LQDRQLHAAQVQTVAGLKGPGPLQANAVDERAIARAHILHEPSPRLRPEAAVALGDARIFQVNPWRIPAEYGRLLKLQPADRSLSRAIGVAGPAGHELQLLAGPGVVGLIKTRMGGRTAPGGWPCGTVAATIHDPDHQLVAADLHPVAHMKSAGLFDAFPVDVGAVLRAEVFDLPASADLLELGVCLRDRGVRQTNTMSEAAQLR
jgi:hypothetical protein